jgi:hypothetical protein
MSRYYAAKRNYWARNNVLIGMGIIGTLVAGFIGVPILWGYINERRYGRSSG